MAQPFTLVDDETVKVRVHVSQSKVFSGRPIDESPFCRSGWQLTLVPGGLGMSERYIAALSVATHETGDEYLFLIDAEDQFPSDSPIRFRLEPGVFRRIRESSALGHVETHLLGGSEVWGMVFHPESVALLGAEPSFMERFAAGLGGLDAIEREFADFAAMGNIGFGEKGNAFVERLTRMTASRSK